MHHTSFATMDSLVSGRDVVVFIVVDIILGCVLVLCSSFSGLDVEVGGSRSNNIVLEVRPLELSDSFPLMGGNVIRLFCGLEVGVGQ